MIHLNVIVLKHILETYSFYGIPFFPTVLINSRDRMLVPLIKYHACIYLQGYGKVMEINF